MERADNKQNKNLKQEVIGKIFSQPLRIPAQRKHQFRFNGSVASLVNGAQPFQT